MIEKDHFRLSLIVGETAGRQIDGLCTHEAEASSLRGKVTVTSEAELGRFLGNRVAWLPRCPLDAHTGS